MARPVEFERDVVLAKAMEQFWKEGFEASSVQKLLDATDINRGTLYNSFGDKETFFKSCLDKYNEELNSTIDATLNNDSIEPLDAIRAWFDAAVVSVNAKQRALGCLLVNSVCESINWNKDLQKVVKASLNGIRKALLQRTRSLEQEERLRDGLKADTAADILMNTLNGLRVDARIGKGPKQLKEIIDFAVSSIIR